LRKSEESLPPVDVIEPLIVGRGHAAHRPTP
jgi:hypothetical protein